MTPIDALMRLPPRDRAVVILRYREDHGVEAVGEMLGMSGSAVKSAGPRAPARLRGTLEVDPLVGCADGRAHARHSCVSTCIDMNERG